MDTDLLVTSSPFDATSSDADSPGSAEDLTPLPYTINPRKVPPRITIRAYTYTRVRNMTEEITPDISTLLPRELASELLSLARSGGASFADLYAEHSVLTGFSLDEQRVKTASYSVLQGVGGGAIRGEQTGYAYADGFAPDALREAARVAAAVARDAPPAATTAPGHPVAFRVTPSTPPFVLHDPATLALDEATRVAM